MEIKKWGNGKMLLKGEYLNNKREEVWSLTENNKQLLIEYYKDGKFKKGFYYKDGKKQRTTSINLTSWLFAPVSLNRIESFIFAPDVPKTEYIFVK